MPNRATNPLTDPRRDLLEECDFEHEVAKSHSPVIQIVLYGIAFPALIDTGSEVCCFSEEVWSQLSSFHKLVPTFPCTGVKVTGAFKVRQRRVKQQSLLTFSINDQEITYEFLLIPDLVYPVILGIDLLRYLQVKIDLESDCINYKYQGKWFDACQIDPIHDYVAPDTVELKAINVKNHVYATPPEFPSVDRLANIRNIVASTDLTVDQKLAFQSILEQNQCVFSDIPGRTNKYVHCIKLRDDQEFCRKQYPIPLAYKDAIQKQLDIMEAWGVIKRTATPYISPLMATLKKNGAVRLCLDARHLNSVMEREHETPRSMDEILRSLNNVKWMSSVDCTHGYYQIPLEENCQKYTGFKFGGKTYCFRTLPFGLSTSTSAFTRCLTSIFGSDFDDFVVTYVDDILIVSESFEQHLMHLHKVLTRLHEAGFTLRLSKCAFFRKEMNFLGYILDSTGIKPDPERTQAILDYTPPRNVKELQRFLGLANFDRSFCPDFSSLSSPLTNLLKKKTKWNWTEVERKAFDDLKRRLAESTLLHHPRTDLPFCLQTDACDTGLGAQLFQVVNGERCAIAWASRKLLARERRYSINELETLSIVWALDKFRVYLLGRQFTVYTDNRSVSYLRTCRLLSPRIARYALAIQEFDFELKHIAGAKNVVADALSRHAASRPPTPSDKLFRILSLFELPSDFSKLLTNIGRDQREDAKLGDIIEKLSTDLKLQERFFINQEGTLYLRRSQDEVCKLCIPKSLASQVVTVYHQLTGHFGTYKTWCCLKREVWWNNMAKDVKKVIRSCEICQKAKMSILPSPELLSIIPETKNDLIAVDLYGPLPRSRGGTTFVFVVVDVFTKYVTFYALKKATTRAILNRLTLDYLPKLGMVKRILSDHGTQFTATKWTESMKELGIQVVFSSIRRPQSNPSERVMREIGRLCRTYCHEQHTRWAWELSNFSTFLNTLVHESTGYSPMELQLGQMPPRLLPLQVQGPSIEGNLLDYEAKLILAKETLISRSARRNARHPARPFLEFQPGDFVLLRASPISSAIKSETKKFLLLFEGPYEIKKLVSRHTYVLRYPNSNKERGTFHAIHLKRYYKPESHEE